MNESAKVANVFNSYLESVTEPLDLFNRVPQPYGQAHVFHIALVLYKYDKTKFRKSFL